METIETEDNLRVLYLPGPLPEEKFYSDFAKIRIFMEKSFHEMASEGPKIDFPSIEIGESIFDSSNIMATFTFAKNLIPISLSPENRYFLSPLDNRGYIVLAISFLMMHIIRDRDFSQDFREFPAPDKNSPAYLVYAYLSDKMELYFLIQGMKTTRNVKIMLNYLYRGVFKKYHRILGIFDY